MRHLLIVLVGALAFIIHPVSAKVIGEQYATCAGHYFTAGVVTAIEGDDENKIYYTLLAFMATNRSYDLMGFEQSRVITDGVVQKYMDLMTKRQNYMDPLIANIERCDKLAQAR